MECGWSVTDYYAAAYGDSEARRCTSLWQMGNSAEIPQIATELYEMSKSYLEQEALQPLRRTGRYAGYSLAGGLLLAIGWLFLSIATVRYTRELLPDTELFSVLGYVIAALALLGVGALLMWRSTKAEGIR